MFDMGAIPIPDENRLFDEEIDFDLTVAESNYLKKRFLDTEHD